jgi:alkanesulfonate monooxygenase SsuD/methylene tetrahydromethanopterin reductase-like flavin-dependent oxidoreductase (luciferase family)
VLRTIGAIDTPTHLLGVALDSAGWHPAAWRADGARPRELFTARYWVDLVQTAERGLLDFVTFEDGLGMQSARFREPDDRTHQVRGRFDAVLLANRVAPVTRHIGLIPTAVTTHTEPFHVATSIQSLDHISRGRAGWRPQVTGRASDAALVGRRTLPDDAEALAAELFAEAADAVEVVRRLWDSWEDDAEIRDVASGRFVDRDKLHYVDFEGAFFRVKGPSIVPRSPQGQPVVAALAHSEIPWRFAASSADVVFVTPQDDDDVPRWVQSIRDAEATVGRTAPPLRILADLVVFLGDDAGGDKARLDELDGRPLRSDAAIFTGTVTELADRMDAWRDHGVDGFRLRPGVLPRDLDAIVEGLVPALQARDARASTYAPGTLRDRLGLPVAVNRYATA